MQQWMCARLLRLTTCVISKLAGHDNFGNDKHVYFPPKFNWIYCYCSMVSVFLWLRLCHTLAMFMLPDNIYFGLVVTCVNAPTIFELIYTHRIHKNRKTKHRQKKSLVHSNDCSSLVLIFFFYLLLFKCVSPFSTYKPFWNVTSFNKYFAVNPYFYSEVFFLFLFPSPLLMLPLLLQYLYIYK